MKFPINAIQIKKLIYLENIIKHCTSFYLGLIYLINDCPEIIIEFINNKSSNIHIIFNGYIPNLLGLTYNQYYTNEEIKNLKYYNKDYFNLLKSDSFDEYEIKNMLKISTKFIQNLNLLSTTQIYNVIIESEDHIRIKFNRKLINNKMIKSFIIGTDKI